MKDNEIPLCKKKKPNAINYRYFMVSFQYAAQGTIQEGFGNTTFRTEGFFPNLNELTNDLKKDIKKQNSITVTTITILNIQELSESDCRDFLKQ